MGLKGLRDRNDEPSDIESEREALRRQRTAAAAELQALKHTLAERVTQVQERERELAGALARVEKREQKLAAAEEGTSRLSAMRTRLAEAKEGRPAKPPAPAQETANPPAKADAQELEARTKELDLREAALKGREETLEGSAAELEQREAALDALAAGPMAADEPAAPIEPSPDELERIEARLAELREAEQAFARTQAELAARSDALALREEALAAGERGLAAKTSPGEDLEALETRIRRLEQRGRPRDQEPQTFSAGLRALQERGLRTGRSPDEPLH